MSDQLEAIKSAVLEAVKPLLEVPAVKEYLASISQPAHDRTEREKWLDEACGLYCHYCFLGDVPELHSASQMWWHSDNRCTASVLRNHFTKTG